MMRLLRTLTVIVILAGGIPHSRARSPSAAPSSQVDLEEATTPSDNRAGAE